MDNSGVFELLKAMKIINTKGDSSITKLQSTEFHASLRRIFSKDSCIEFVCDKCKTNNTAYVKKLTDDLSTTQKYVSQSQVTNTKLAKECRKWEKEYHSIEEENLNLHDHIAQLEMKLETLNADFCDAEDGSSDKQLKPASPSKLKTKNKSNMKSVTIKTNLSFDDKFAVHVSKFKPDAECCLIKKHILEHTNINDEKLFTITRLLGPNRNMKYINFVSFKISAANQDVYDKIIDKNTWSGKFTAVPFDPNFKKSVKRSHNNHLQPASNVNDSKKPTHQNNKPPYPKKQPKQPRFKLQNDRLDKNRPWTDDFELHREKNDWFKQKSRNNGYHRNLNPNFQRRGWNNHRPQGNELKSLLGRLLTILDNNY